jgi:hypothetical protein
MKHYLHLDELNSSNTNPLLEQVYSILDSRIQFIDYQVANYFKSCTNCDNSASIENVKYQGPSTAKSLMNNFENLLQFTGLLQDDLKLLQILRAWLKEETVQIVLDLLTNNKYLNYSENKLEHLLKKEILTLYKREQLS